MRGAGLRAAFSGAWPPLAALGCALLVFGAIAPRFLTLGNAFEILRASVEIGLLAVALTPILVTGGIDLSVGSVMGLAAVMFGLVSQQWGWGAGMAGGVALLVGVAAGALNAFLVARLAIPPLIVTLGTLSLFRGIAEGITEGAANYSGFSSTVLALGQGYLLGVVPAQFPILLLQGARTRDQGADVGCGRRARRT